MKRISLFFSTLLMAVAVCAQYTQLTNLPTIYIDTYNRQAVTSKTAYVYAKMMYVDNGQVVQYDSLQIRGRGNSTWNLAKKPYRIKFHESTKFLGKGYAKNKSWTLLANHADKSLLRNAVTFTLGDYLGQDFSPAAHFVDLVLNGTYLGNYQVSDQVNVDNKRVEIFEQEEEATDSSNITGGYLVEIDGFGTSEKVYFRTGKNLIVSVKSPDEDIINTAQKNYIKQYLDNFETTLFGRDFKDSEKGYRSIVDSLSLLSWYIATELSANVDGFWSTYLYKDKDDPKLYFGPLWDYDIAYNNCDRVGDVTHASMIEKGFGTDLTKVWMQQMIQDPWFNKTVNDMWKQKVDEGLEEYLYNYIDSMATYIDASQKKNYSKYSMTSKVYNELYLYSTYADYVNQLKRFIGDHMKYLTKLFAERAGNDSDDPSEEDQTLNPFVLTEGYYYRVYNKSTNKVLDIAGQSSDEGANVVIWSSEYERRTQLWEIKQVGDYFLLINSATGLAFNDPSPTQEVGTPLNMAIPNETDERQLWKFVTVNENGNYNIINVYTDHAINNSGGASNDGNNILSYTNDNRNSESNNRQWRIVPEEIIPDYIPEEVKNMLSATVSEAKSFLNSLIEGQVGTGVFQYSESEISTLKQMVLDTETFESTVQDDYILANVNLTNQLEAARKVILPNETDVYTIQHKSSGYYLKVSSSRLCVQSSKLGDEGQRFKFEHLDEGNGVLLKSEDGLYVMLGTENSWTMIGNESVTDEQRATFNVKRHGDSYRIHTQTGLLGTDDISENSTVYANKRIGYPEEELRSEWVLELDTEGTELKESIADLFLIIGEYRNQINAISTDWIGEKPFQISSENYENCINVLAEAESEEYSSVEECNSMIQRLNEAMAAVALLNKPSDGNDYYLEHASGEYLSVADGLILATPDTLDLTQRFRLIEIAGSPNTYHIYSNGAYISVTDGDRPMLELSETPKDNRGEFVVKQVGQHEFTLTTVAGYFGVEDNHNAQNATLEPDALDHGSNIRWRLKEAVAIPDNINSTHNIDYAVKYNKEAQTISFVSNDINALSDVDVNIYTVGGRLLYTFKATQTQSLAALPSGTYIVSWKYMDKLHSVKFKK